MFGRWFGVDGVPWCAIFVSYCFDVGAGIVLCRGWHGAGVGPRGVAYVPTLVRLATGERDVSHRARRGRATSRSSTGTGESPDHVGIVDPRRLAVVIETVEGNTAVGNDSDGGEVMRRERAPRSGRRASAGCS